MHQYKNRLNTPLLTEQEEELKKIISVVDDYGIRLPTSLQKEFNTYQFNENKKYSLSVTVVGVLIYFLFFIPTKYFMPDMIKYDGLIRIIIMTAYIPSMWYLIERKKNAAYLDIFTCFFCTVAALSWLSVAHFSTFFNTPHFLMANAAFVFSCSILVTTQFVYIAISTAIISLATIFVMFTNYEDSLAACYEIIFAFVPIIIFGLMFCWKNIQNAKKQFLQQKIANLEKLNLSQNNQQLLNTTKTDALTNIPNRRAFESQFNHLIYKIDNADEKVAVLMADIDFFKPYNDNYGHLEGDQTLRRIASTLNNLASAHGVHVFRFGGEEFVIVQHYQHIGAVKNLSNAVINSVRKLSIAHQHRHDDKEIITISLGATVFDPSQHNNMIDILSDSDAKLYDVKASGRDHYLL